MADKLDYALLANRVYRRPEENKINLPAEWQELAWYDDHLISGYSAGVYQGSGEIVISFTGTNEAKLEDFALANLPAGVGIISTQVIQAMKLVMQVMSAHPGATISFTGHSLGGGLASLMSVFFNLNATTFDAAPFQPTAVNSDSLSVLRSLLALSGFSNPAFDAYVDSKGADFSARESKVTSYFLKGEILELIRFPWSVIEGDAKPAIDIGTPSILETDSLVARTLARIELHSMTLLQAAMYSNDFRLGLTQQSQAVGELLSTSLYGRSPDGRYPDLLTKLMNDHVADLADGSTLARLDALGQDLFRIGTAGTVADKVLNKGILDVLAEFYNFTTAAVTSGIVEEVNGGISLDMSRISANSDGLGKFRLSQALYAFLKERGDLAQPLSGLATLVVENGTSALSYDGSAGNDLAIGGEEVDTLKGAGGDDFLYGLEGNDDLDGGAGNDYLAGGVGTDDYRFFSNDSASITVDQIIDSDGSGRIWFDGSIVVAGQRTSEHAWLDSTGKLKLTFLDNGYGQGTLVIDVIDTQDTIRVRDWALGDLGITLGGQVPAASGSLMTNEDDLFGSNGNNAGNDTVSGLGGNDGLEGGAGNDYLDGGAGNDLILGGTGDDVLLGGDGNDYIYDGYEQADFHPLDTTPDPDTGKSQQDRFEDEIAQLGAAVLDRGKAWYIAHVINAPGWSLLNPNGTPSGNDTIDAGMGNDTVVAGDGNDTILGGGGSDQLIGGFDNDVIFGGDDDDIINGDYPYGANAAIAVGWRHSDQANPNGNDVIDGGAGSDTISGNGGNDVLAGGDGADRIWGRGLSSPADGNDADADFLDGGADNDLLTGDDGNDVILGGTGDDVIWGDNNDAGTRHGNDNIDAGAGNDIANGDGGDDVIAGGSGADMLSGDSVDIDGSLHGRDLIHGGADDDIIDGNGGADTLYGDDGDDQLIGDKATNETLAAAYHGNDFLDGGAGNDLLIGNGGDDQLIGGSGDDELQGGDGNDNLDGGLGKDLLFGQDGNDTLDGGDGDDELQGGVGNDNLQGDFGKDLLFGQDGDDTLGGGDGDDKLYGDAGDDRLGGGNGADTIVGGDGSDVLYGDDGNDILDGEAGNDQIYGGAGNDIIDGDNGDDLIQAGLGDDSIYGGFGRDVIHAEEGNDVVTAAEGDDDVHGGAGNDTLFGNDGNDLVNGGDGDDELIGGAGNDTLIGGAGLNRYYFDRAFGQDVVQLEAGSQDQIYLQDGITADEVVFSREGDDLLLAMDDGSQLRVAGYFVAGTAAWLQLGDASWISRAQMDAGFYYGGIGGGGSGADNLQGTEGDDRLYGRGGDDTLDGLGGNDLIHGGDGNDTLTDGQGDDLVQGGAGNDIINLVYNGGAFGQDIADGGAGDDTYNISRLSGYDVITNLDAAGAGSDTINLVGITQNMVTNYQIDGTTLTIYVSEGNGQPNPSLENVIVLEGFLANSSHRVRFAEGTEVTSADFAQRTWNGSAGDDVFVGSYAPDLAFGSAGNDNLSGLGGNDWLYGGDGDDVLDGGDGDDSLYGEAGNDIVRGGAGNDRLHMAYYDNGIDRYIGGSGNDGYYLQHNYGWSAFVPRFDGAGIEEDDDGGIDTLYTNFYHVTLSANVENMVQTAANYWWDAPSRLTGNALNNVIQLIQMTFSSSLSFRLDGGAGADTLMGTTSRDTYVVDSYADVIIEQNTTFDSIDTVETGLDYSIQTRLDLENIRLTGTAVSATGNSDANVLEGHLVAGVNQLTGLGGNDTYLVTLKDQVIEAAGGGNDTVVISGWDELTDIYRWVSVSDYANVENLTLDNVATQGPFGQILMRGNLQGDAGDNVLMGNMMANEIRGGAGNDTIRGYYKLPYLSEGNNISSVDLLYGEDGDDTIEASVYGGDLYGGRGNDVLIGTDGGQYNYNRSGSDRFFYEIGDGTDRIRSVNGSRDLDQVIFGEGIDPDAITWSQDGTSLIVQVGSDPNDRLIVENYWREDTPGEYTLVKSVDEFVFFDGTIRRGGLDHLPYTNNPPVVNWFSIEDPVRAGEAFQLLLPAGTFVDEPDDVLTYSLSGPDWMSIDPATGTVSGTPSVDEEYVSFTILATDRFGQQASLYLNLKILVVVTGTQGDDELLGTARSEEIRGLAGDDRIIANGGNDVLYGGLGDDTYVIGQSDTATIVELAGEGYDTVEFSQFSYDAPDEVERLVMVEGSQAWVAYGGAGANELIGNSQDNHLNGGGGADRMVGGAGNDQYDVDDAGDVVVELANGGTDDVTTTVSWTLSANVEIGRLGEGASLNLTGNATANTLHGNASDNTLDGGLGSDTLYGYEGNDTYYVDVEADRVLENQGEGVDTIVRSFGSQFVLANNVENLRLTGSATQGNGNALDNVIEGNASANTLMGLDGNDELRGMAGNDTLWGGNGNDVLKGGEGDDLYAVDATTGSDVIDNTGGGTDTLYANGIAISRLSFARDGNDLLVRIDGATTPAARVTGHFLGGDATLDYVQASDNRYSAAQIAAIINGGSNPGNGFDQTITGTAAGEQLTGSAGKDLIEGLGGADTLFGMGGNDTLRGGDGNDYLAGGNGSGAGSGNDVLEGGQGNDTLRGEDGTNTLTGGAGDDQYVYGGGSDLIDNTGGGTDWLIFQNGITTSQLGFTRDGDDLVITVNGNASQRVIVNDHFLGGDMAIDYLQPASGSALNTAAINALVNPGNGSGGTPGTGNDADYPSVKTGTAAGEQIVGTSGRDLIKGLGGNDTLFGMGADDKLDGGDGDDYLSGGNGSFSGSGVDILIGGAGADQLVGEDGNDLLFGGTGDDTYFYAAGSGADTIDNTGGGTDWLYLDAISRTRLAYHRDGDDLIVRVDGDAGQQMRVIDHFLGGEHAIAYVQPGDGGYAISAATIAGQLTPLGSSRASASPSTMHVTEGSVGIALPVDEATALVQAMEGFAVRGALLQAPGSLELPPYGPEALPIAATRPVPGASAIHVEKPQQTTLPSTSLNHAGSPQAELQHLVDSLGSFTDQSAPSAANDPLEERQLALHGSSRNYWGGSQRYDGRLRQLEL